MPRSPRRDNVNRASHPPRKKSAIIDDQPSRTTNGSGWTTGMTAKRLDHSLKAFQLLMLACSAGLWWAGYHSSAFFLTMAALTVGVAKDLWLGLRGQSDSGQPRRIVTLDEFAIIFGLIGVIFAIVFVIIGEPKESLPFVGLAAFSLMAWVSIRASTVPDQQRTDQGP